MALIMGMNSGSSFDGIDVVLSETHRDTDGYPVRPVFIDGLTVPWPPEVASAILRAFANEVSIFELCRLNYVVGAVFAGAANTLLARHGLDAAAVEVLGVDGQTIYQEPSDPQAILHLRAEDGPAARWLSGAYPCGLQIGESSVIAALTGVTTVSQFRPADHALGGTGAPLMQFLDFVAFRDLPPLLTVNIGGIANCHLAHRDRSRMRAFDTGPGNVMLDHTARRLFQQPYDRDGAIAASGMIDDRLLADCLGHPFFARRPPRSAWRLDFGADYADAVIDRHPQVAPADLMATFTAFTATAIVRAITEHIADLASVELLVSSGGGTRNPTLMTMLRERLPQHLRLTTSDEFGIPSQYKEATKFATLAYATLHHLANNIPRASGASGYTILGKIALAPRLAEHTGDERA
jgi:anhydro-N-acetylmuramic acid kinase